MAKLDDETTDVDYVAALEHLLGERFSCRAFRSDPVDSALIEQIVRIAQRTASWCNAQPWQVLITRGTATDDFRTAMVAHVESGAAPNSDLANPRAYQGVYRERRRECGFQLYDAVGIGRDDRAAAQAQAMQNFHLFGAPHVAIITSDEALGAYGAVDCGAFISNFMLAARALGIDSVPQAAIAGHSGFVRDYFALPADRIMVCAISFGYADTAHPVNGYRTRRAHLDEVLSWQDQAPQS